MFKTRLRSKGFTLIELLVVIAIIGLLATLSVIALSNARAKSRDSKRLADIKQMQTSLALYYNQTDHYPTTDEFNSGTISYFSAGIGTTTYMKILPAAPVPNDGPCSASGNGYVYTPTDGGASYTLSFCIGSGSNNLAGGSKCATPGGIINVDCNGSGGGGCTPNCSGQTCGASDGCSGLCSSGSCTSPDTCGGSGTPNQCGCTGDCSGKDCGASDGCGGFCSSGSCSGGMTCTNNHCAGVLAYAGGPCDASGQNCGSLGGYYRTVQIGTQIWLKDNLNAGTMINTTLDETDNSILEKYCNNNDPSECATYGAYYHWGEAVQYINGASNSTEWDPVPTGNIQGICPAGWHIPSYADWLALVIAASNNHVCDYPASGHSVNNCWLSGTNLEVGGSTGFDGLFAGFHYYDDGGVYDIGSTGYFQSSSLDDPNTPGSTSRDLELNNGGGGPIYANIGGQGRRMGESVRCLKD